jgi:hypothetical protein
MTASFTQEETNSLLYQPLWYNIGLDDRITLEAILEEYIEANTDDYLIDDAKYLLEIIQNPIFKRYKDVIHCGVSH